ncbi:MAG TPA: L-threonylcarbamoyladenylate synthase [Gemmatimonadaceae bacterium]|nr:L-threonylcarbamoyladenylate synthase [Gemmatimonadaceae bacterium]
MTARPEIVRVDAAAPAQETIARAAAIIRDGGLVAMPTETVYGLAGNALDAASIARIYAAKGRPSHNPLIAHVADAAQAQALAAEWPEMARALAARFWPGPLTLVVRRKALVPSALTAGLDTFGVRVPDHPVALALIRAAGVPLAAPSANRFTEVSPVTAAQVARGLGAAVDLILDAGHTRVGIESSVVDVSGGRPTLLRPGMITQDELEAVVGPLSRHRGAAREDAPRPAPGMVARHYAPRARVTLVPSESLTAAIAGARQDDAAATIGCIVHTQAPPADLAFARQLPAAPGGYASALYDALHDADAAGCTALVIEDVPADAAWDAIRDRLARAAHPA